MAYEHWSVNKTKEQIESLIKNSIIKKLKHWGSYITGEKYLSDKILVVNIQFPHELSYDIVSIRSLLIAEKPPFIPEIYLIGANKEFDDKHYKFNVTHINLHGHTIITYWVYLDFMNYNLSVWQDKATTLV